MGRKNYDFLHGARSIADFLGVPVRRAYYMLENGQIPAARIGDKWSARKSRLIEHFEQRETETLARGSNGKAA